MLTVAEVVSPAAFTTKSKVKPDPLPPVVALFVIVPGAGANPLPADFKVIVLGKPVKSLTFTSAITFTFKSSEAL